MQRESIYAKMTNAEKEVACYLKENGIKWSYEHPIFVWDENKRPRVWAPDFYLIPFDVYVEVCGSESFDYEYRKSIYIINGYKVMFLHLFKDTIRWRKYLLNYIERVEEYRNGYLKELKEKLN